MKIFSLLAIVILSSAIISLAEANTCYLGSPTNGTCGDLEPCYATLNEIIETCADDGTQIVILSGNYDISGTSAITQNDISITSELDSVTLYSDSPLLINGSSFIMQNLTIITGFQIQLEGDFTNSTSINAFSNLNFLNIIQSASIFLINPSLNSSSVAVSFSNISFNNVTLTDSSLFDIFDSDITSTSLSFHTISINSGSVFSFTASQASFNVEIDTAIFQDITTSGGSLFNLAQMTSFTPNLALSQTQINNFNGVSAIAANQNANVAASLVLFNVSIEDSHFSNPAFNISFNNGALNIDSLSLDNLQFSGQACIFQTTACNFTLDNLTYSNTSAAFLSMNTSTASSFFNMSSSTISYVSTNTYLISLFGSRGGENGIKDITIANVSTAGIFYLGAEYQAYLTEFNNVMIIAEIGAGGYFFTVDGEDSSIILESVTMTQLNGTSEVLVNCESISAVSIYDGTSIVSAENLSSECTLRCNTNTQTICGQTYNELANMIVYIVVAILVVFFMAIGLFYVLRLSRKQAAAEHV